MSELPSSDEHTFEVDKFSWVIAHSSDGGFLKSQSVDTLLLLAILSELQSINQKLDDKI